ncbi:MAG TPA: extracellular solute-binding protein [Treponemataceae bacterium]|nr:extracellular solute-binding protein [Treponemataceae bacterium]
MKISRKVLSAVLVAILATSMVFAGGSKQSSADEGKVKLTVLNYMDMTSANSADEVDAVWKAFEKANPDIQIEREDLFNEPFHQKTEAYAAAGQLPDVLYAWPSGRSTTLHTKKLLKDLEPLLEKDGLVKSFAPVALAPQGGGYLGELPSGLTQTHVLFVNKAVLDACGLKPAKTYEEMKAQVPVLKAKGYETILMANAETWVMQSCLFSDIAGRFGGKDWDKAILDGKTKFTDAGFVNALKFVQTLYKDGVLSQNTLATNYGDVVGQFATNKGAYLIDGDWRVGAFITDKSTGQALISPDVQGKNISLTVFPEIAGAKINHSTSGVVGTGWAMSASIPAGSAKEVAAWKLIKWLNSKEIQTWRVSTGAVSTASRVDLDTSKLTLEPMQKMAGAFAGQYSYSNPVIDAVFEGPVYEPLNSGLQEIGLGSKTPEQVAASVQKAFDAWKAAKK